MPELPDVEVFRAYFASTSLKKEIVGVKLDNNRILGSVSRKKLVTALRGDSFVDTSRHGKYFFAERERGGVMAVHFGMTGFFKYYKKSDAEPEHPRLILEFENSYKLALDMTRMLGRVDLAESMEKFVEKEELGPDALDIGEEEFAGLFDGYGGGVKSLLMNQGKIAGIGNVYSDEILFQACIHPKAKASNLKDEQIPRLYESMRDVFHTAINKKADPSKFPTTYLLRRKHENGNCPRACGEMMEIRVGGRTGHFCPKCQKA